LSIRTQVPPCAAPDTRRHDQSSTTLAKCVRDYQEDTSVVNRVDQARLDKLLTEHDRFTVPAS